VLFGHKKKQKKFLRRTQLANNSVTKLMKLWSQLCKRLDFQNVLSRWNFCVHVALSVLKDYTFRKLILYICPAVAPVFVRVGRTIRKWITDEFSKRQLRIKEGLVLSEFFGQRPQESQPFGGYEKVNMLPQW